MVHRSNSIFLCNSVTCMPSVCSRSFFFSRHFRALSRFRSNRLFRFSSDSSSATGCADCGDGDDDDDDDNGIVLFNVVGSCRCCMVFVVYIKGCKFGSNDDPFGSCTEDVNGLFKNGAIILNGNVGIVVILDIVGDDDDTIVPGGGHA